MTLTIKDLSRDQLDAYNDILRWKDDPTGHEVLSLGGYGGTGKSTLVSLVAEQIHLPAFCAYTGKAASVLKRKLQNAGVYTVGTQKKGPDGLPSIDPRPYCGTIHSLIYAPCECREPKVVELHKPCPEKDCAGETSWTEAGSRCEQGHVGLIKTAAAFEKLKPQTKFIYAKKDADGSCMYCHGKEWNRRETLDRHYGLIIVDEASMVDDAMLRDLKSYNVPILAVGDHGQLPPVGGYGSLMKNPDIRLERIHRQAEGNPIIALSKIIRETGRFPDDMADSEAVVFKKLRFMEPLIEQRYADASPERLLEMGLACATNRRRLGLNLAVRRARGVARTGRELPVKGEHVICLRNMKTRTGGAPPIYNGMRGVLTSNTIPKQNKNYRGEALGESQTHIMGSVEFPEDGIQSIEYEMLRAQFVREKTFGSVEELQRETGISSFAMANALFDFGYAMTVHKMQGSQFDDLVVCAEKPGPMSNEDWARWAYTAVTRAAKKLTVLR